MSMTIPRIGRLIILCLWTATSAAQEMAVPVSVQIPLFLKILTFNRNLKTTAGREIAIGVIYQAKFRTSLNAKDEFERIVKETSTKSPDERPLRCLPIEVGDGNDLAGVLAKVQVDILYVTPLRALAMESITSVSRAQKRTTFTGVPEYVESGLAVGIGVKGDKPLIMVNLTAAKNEGADFSSQLLKLARIIE